jgi:hypothetical protein
VSAARKRAPIRRARLSQKDVEGQRGVWRRPYPDNPARLMPVGAYHRPSCRNFVNVL